MKIRAAVGLAALAYCLPALAQQSANPSGLTLERALDLAESNPDLEVSAERIAQAHADARSAFADFLPDANATGRIGFDVTPPGEPLALQAQPSRTVLLQARWTLDAEAFPLLTAARHGEMAARALHAERRQDLLFEVARAFWSVVLADRQVAASLAAVTRAEELVSASKTRAASESDLGLLRARIAESTARQAVRASRGSREHAEAVLARLTGEASPLAVVPPAELASSAPDAAAVWEAAKSRRFDVRAAEETLEARHALRRAASRSYLPILSAQGTAFYTHAPAGEEDGGAAALVATWNLFDGGIREARRARTRSLERESLAARDSTVRRAREEVARASAELTTSLTLQDGARETAELARTAQARAADSYRAGAALYLEAVEANAVLFQAEAARNRAEADAALAVLALRRAAGEPLP